MWKVLLDQWTRLASESFQSNLEKNSAYAGEDVISFYQKYIPKNEWVFIGVILITAFWVLTKFEMSSQHIFALIVVVGIFYLQGRSQIKSFGESLELNDTELRFLNSILFTTHTYNWQSQAAAIPTEERSLSTPIPANKSYLYLYPIVVRFYYEQRYLVFLHFGGYRDSLTRMNHLIEHWYLLKRTQRLDLLKAYYTWFNADCTKCVNHFAEIYNGLTLTPDFQENYRTALRQLEEIIQGLREDCREYITSILGKDEINNSWFSVESNQFPLPNDAGAPDCDPTHSYIPNQ